MARPVRLEYAADLAARVFNGIGFVTHTQGTDLRLLARRIKQGVTVAMVADHDIRRIGGAFVPFFGQLAYTPIGPAALAAMTGTDLVVAITIPRSRRNPGRIPSYQTRIEQIELQHSNDRHIDIAENTRRWMAVIESYIRAYPEEWSWMNRRWRTQPNERPRAQIWEPAFNRTGWEVPPLRPATD
jgi:KDO2-lipid IV(A) lauroyltransferase